VITPNVYGVNNFYFQNNERARQRKMPTTNVVREFYVFQVMYLKQKFGELGRVLARKKRRRGRGRVALVLT